MTFVHKSSANNQLYEYMNSIHAYEQLIFKNHSNCRGHCVVGILYLSESQK
jgi:hypothetical protein